MGFGIVLSGRGRDRIITERIVLAMPENGIGLFPDVVFAYIAAQSPGEGAVVRSNQIRKSKRCWNNIAQTQSEPRLKLLLPQIISTFGGNKSVEEIMNELEKHQESADTLGKIVSTAHVLLCECWIFLFLDVKKTY
ncbi:3-hydroxyisobutyryl-CoA hydrolase-like protein 4, mitochondrial isoform X1 [Olea europaea var. sylvestris]|uniref:3-hydroxyisobutyryl-CoA hydrolase-like protein 4, mitochondrial isoform X1 n=1 Tax=Olea europaea var. sylvestris TaxID=158386 RepID=UPI000C1D0FC8|nr:3-hydroxyisobutyryl-CoA hydrolase-like protein 4, mitochondrial isoform X1 [Olea europaea var. sylvestris]